jgi:hypothetical protein
VAAVGSAGALSEPLTQAPETDRPGQASMRSGAWAKRLAKTANGPSKPATTQCGGTRASCSWPSATRTLPSAAVTEGGPKAVVRPAARASTATLAAVGETGKAAEPGEPPLNR